MAHGGQEPLPFRSDCLSRSMWSEKHSCLKFNFNVLQILFPLSCCRGFGPKTVSGWCGREKWKTKNDNKGSNGTSHLRNNWEDTPGGWCGGVCKWYVNWYPWPAQLLQPLYFRFLGVGHWEYSPSVYCEKLLTANLTHPIWPLGKHFPTLVLCISFYTSELDA
jgi:hypothetical protein